MVSSAEVGRRLAAFAAMVAVVAAMTAAPVVSVDSVYWKLLDMPGAAAVKAAAELNFIGSAAE